MRHPERSSFLIIAILGTVLSVAGCTPSSSSPSSSGTPATSGEGYGLNWGFPFRPGIVVNIGLPENHADSRLHDANYASLTDDIPNGRTYQFSQGTGWDYASLDVGALGSNGIASTDVKDENVLALAHGTVLAVDHACNAVLIDYGKDAQGHAWWGIYLHLNSTRIWVQSGDTVEAGTPVGVPTQNVSGCSQISGFQHVHFAMLRDQAFVSMRGMTFCGFAMGDNGLLGVADTPPNPGFQQNVIFTVPSSCPSEKPFLRPNPTQSSAGYRVLRGEVTGMHATIVAPTVSGAAGSGMNASINVGCWDGNDNVSSTACLGIFFDGTVQNDGSVQYSVTEEVNAVFTSALTLSVVPGNILAFDMELATGSQDSWTYTVTNVTQGQSVNGSAMTDIASAGHLSATYPTFDIGQIQNEGFASFTPIAYTYPQVRFGTTWRDLISLPYQPTQLFLSGTLVGSPTTLNGTTFTVDNGPPGI
jgi:hypothetical protein